MAKVRCLNIDWLEVYCLEPCLHDANYFRALGYDVVSRNYGTPLYEQMFTILQEDWPYIEIRRKPHQQNQLGEKTILANNACHIRFANRTCYLPGCVNLLRSFLVAHGYQFVSISRIDICADFNVFDNGMKPQNFIEKWFRADISKLYQGRFAAHGSDRWSSREVNSVKWGRPTSAISTKIYNKSKELREVGDKFYIRDCWKAAGLDESSDVWRVEFSINSQAKVLRLRKPKNQEIAEQTREQENEINFRTLSRFDTSQRLLSTFGILASHYFRFKFVERTARGALVEKRYCKDVPLFHFVPADTNYVIAKVSLQRALNRTERILVRKLKDMMKNFVIGYRQREIIFELLKYLAETRRADISDMSEEDWQEVRNLKLTNESVEQDYFVHSRARRMADFVQNLPDAQETEVLLDDIFTTLPDAPF